MLRNWIVGCVLTACVIGLTAVLIVRIALSEPSSAGGTLRSGRTVLIDSRALYLSAQLGEDTATFWTKGKTILVQPTAVLVDGAEIASLDTDASFVQIHVNENGIDVVADGRPVDSKKPHVQTGSPLADRQTERAVSSRN